MSATHFTSVEYIFLYNMSVYVFVSGLVFILGEHCELDENGRSLNKLHCIFLHSYIDVQDCCV